MNALESHRQEFLNIHHVMGMLHTSYQGENFDLME